MKVQECADHALPAFSMKPSLTGIRNFYRFIKSAASAACLMSRNNKQQDCLKELP